jgi:hypothetical protein
MVATEKTAEAKRANFVKVAQKRTTKALRAIAAIGSLGNRNLYTYSDADRAKIIGAMNKEIETVNARLNGKGGDDGFQLD